MDTYCALKYVGTYYQATKMILSPDSLLSADATYRHLSKQQNRLSCF